MYVGNEQAVQLLIQNGANINEVNDGETALHVAAAAGNLLEFQATKLVHLNGFNYLHRTRKDCSAANSQWCRLHSR